MHGTPSRGCGDHQIESNEISMETTGKISVYT